MCYLLAAFNWKKREKNLGWNFFSKNWDVNFLFLVIFFKQKRNVCFLISAQIFFYAEWC